MQVGNLIYEKNGELGKIWINRPDKKNALDQQTWKDLGEVIHSINVDREIKVIIIQGVGDDSFAAGADLKWMYDRPYLDILEYSGQDVLQMIDDSPKIFVAAINGNAFGGGCEIALACDIRVAHERALMGQLEINLGIIPSAGATQRLSRIVGLGFAKELILTGKVLNAKEAERIHLVNHVYSDEEFEEKTEKLAQTIASKGEITLRLAKGLINASTTTDIHTGLLMEKYAQTIVFTTEDRKEGIGSFLEKRKPEFKGK